MNLPPEPSAQGRLAGYDQKQDMLWVALPGVGSRAQVRIPGAWLRAEMPSQPDAGIYVTLALSTVVFAALVMILAWLAPFSSFSSHEKWLVVAASLAGAYAEKIGNALAKILRERRRKARP